MLRRLSLLLFVFSFLASLAVSLAAQDRGAKNLGSVLVFSGTGWYRHPETPAMNGWLARLEDELQMQGGCL